MRRLLALPVLLLAAFAFAQEGPPPREMLLGRKVFFVFRPEIKAELKLTSDQEKKILDAFEGSLQVDGDRIMLTLTPEADLDGMEKEAAKALSEDQRKRLDEAWIQELEGLALADEAVAKKLALTSDQKKSVEKVVAETAERLQELFMAGHDEGTQKEAAALRKEGGKKMLALLTADQSKVYEGLKGKPLKKKASAKG